MIVRNSLEGILAPSDDATVEISEVDEDSINRLTRLENERRLEDVVREIKETMDGNKSWKAAIASRSISF